jgi:type III secretory pathway component EscT
VVSVVPLVAVMPAWPCPFQPCHGFCVRTLAICLSSASFCRLLAMASMALAELGLVFLARSATVFSVTALPVSAAAWIIAAIVSGMGASAAGSAVLWALAGAATSMPTAPQPSRDVLSMKPPWGCFGRGMVARKR